jgi:hypothetical protein
MESESMENYSRTVQDDSATISSVPSTPGLTGSTKFNQEPYGSSPRSTPIVSTAAITALFQTHRFDIISVHSGPLLRKFLGNRYALPVAAGIAAAIAWNGAFATIPLSLIAPLLVYQAKSRWQAYAFMFCYYAAAGAPLIRGARAFFGDQGTPLIGLSLCIGSALLLALPWGLFFSRSRKIAMWLVPMCVLFAAIPPLGVIGWASPLISAGVLFPGTGWLGLAFVVMFLSLFRLRPGWSVVVLVLCSLVAHICYTEPLTPEGWAAIDTQYGGAGQGEPNFATEFRTHQSIQETILSSKAVVLLFPEHLVSHWNEATEAFWESTLTTAATQHRTVLIGAGISLPATSRNPFAQNRFQNVLLGRGQVNDAFYQERIPIPIGMWKPFGTDGVPLNLLGSGTIRVRDQKAAVLICYEQILAWPFLSSALEHPTILLTSSNDYWARNTRIPEIQRSSAESWARLFHLPMLSATNF